MIYKYLVPLSVVCELTGIKESKLKSDFESLIHDTPEYIPLSALPQDVQEQYVKLYLLHDTFIDIDPFAISAFDSGMPKRFFPIATALGFLEFARRIIILRKAHLISQEYFGIGDATEQLNLFAAENGISYRTLTR